MFGQRLRLARRRAGLSMQKLAESIDPPVSAQAISKYEAQKMMPSSSVLVSLGKSLGVSLDFLLGGQVNALESLQWRKTSKVSAKDKAMAEAVVVEKLERYLAIEEILDLPHLDPFSEIRVGSLAGAEKIDAKALEVRKKWKLGLDPIPNMTDLLEGKGVKIIEADLPDRIDGMACHVKMAKGPPAEVIVVSSRTGIERKRFNLAHELAHRVVAGDGMEKKDLEKAMNRFAGAFLVPKEHLEAEVGSSRGGITSQEIMQLKRIYGVSAAALLMRLGQVGILHEGTVEYAFKTYANTWRKKEPEPMATGEGPAAFEKPLRFERLIWQALGEKLISPVRASQMLDEPLASVEEGIRGN